MSERPNTTADKAYEAWPKKRVSWLVPGLRGSVKYMSIPFTWELPKAYAELQSPDLMWETAVVGGPAVKLMPGFFAKLPWVTEGVDVPGVLQRVNPWASRTTTGCFRRCTFCGVSRIEPEWRELDDWPDLPVLCDNNILAASIGHFDRVCDRLEKWGWADFNQGLDSALMNEHHAWRIKRIGRPIVRLALDNDSDRGSWEHAYGLLRQAKIPKSLIRTYVLVGHTDGPEQGWDRCKFVEATGTKALPMWYHPLDALEKNVVTGRQTELGWDDYERRRIMQHFYWHKTAVKK